MAFDNLKSDFDRDGVVVLRGLIDPEVLKAWQCDWAEFSKKQRPIGFNPVSVEGPFPGTLARMYAYPPLLDAVCEIFGPDIALYNHRFVVKDKDSRGPVFLHQDTGYHVGWPTKLSAFVALSPCDHTNGGLGFIHESHKWGYLGDAGEINFNAPPGSHADWPALDSGDVVLMHSATWHASTENKRGIDRILADIIYQPANDPSGIELLRGEWRCEPQPWLRGDNLFVRSRTSRLKEMQEKLKAAGLE